MRNKIYFNLPINTWQKVLSGTEQIINDVGPSHIHTLATQNHYHILVYSNI